jgi:hypothetical protein
MYRNCIFCSASLGSNESIEHFPVGRALAFDAAKGRLWAVCPKCARWNLAPIEERWEAIEDAERLFRDTRLRAQAENVGLTKLHDGTRLIRIGAALPGEMALWRYGRELKRRARRYRRVTGMDLLAGQVPMFMMAGGMLAGPLGFLGGIALEFAALKLYNRRKARAGEAVIHLREGRALHSRNMLGAYLEPDGDGVALNVPVAEREWVRLPGSAASAALARGATALNVWGASPAMLDAALTVLQDAGSADAYLAGLARRHGTLWFSFDHVGWNLDHLTSRYWIHRAERQGVPHERIILWERTATRIHSPLELVALEMALHERTERRALEGELAELKAMWREAEEIAEIADRLPDALHEEVR